MWFKNIIEGGINKVIDSASKGLDSLFTSDEERLKAQALLEQIRTQLTSKLIDSFTEALKVKRDIIIAEIKGESWVQRNWRPVTMLLFAYIIANEYVIAPYVEVLLNVDLKPKPLDPRMWDLLTLGMGGYVSALGVKKVVEATKWGK